MPYVNDLPRTFQVTDKERLLRFLILGHEGGTYYATQRELTMETLNCVDRMLQSDPSGVEVVSTIHDVSLNNRGAKNDPAVFALAYLVSKGGEPSWRAMDIMPSICRTGRYLFDYLETCKRFNRGWGKAFKRSVGRWYDRHPVALAKQVTKYASRGGWTHRDVLRKCHFTTRDPDLNQVLKFVAQPKEWEEGPGDADSYLMAVREVQNPMTTISRAIVLIHQYNLPWEVLPTCYLNYSEIWGALLESMPLHAMLRNLGKMTSVGAIGPMGSTNGLIRRKLNLENLLNYRVHPVALLIAYFAYKLGFSRNLRWQPKAQILSALEAAFYESFQNIEPTNKRLMLGIDVSGSMRNRFCGGTDVMTCRDAAAVMAMVTARAEPNHYIHAFSTSFVPLTIQSEATLDSVQQSMRGLPFARTRIAAPIEYALENNIDVDTFIVYTDNEVNIGANPYEVLQRYRDKTGIPAKFATFAMQGSNVTVANPGDAGMMDFIGFDVAAPVLLNDFINRPLVV